MRLVLVVLLAPIVAFGATYLSAISADDGIEYPLAALVMMPYQAENVFDQPMVDSIRNFVTEMLVMQSVLFVPIENTFFLTKNVGIVIFYAPYNDAMAWFFDLSKFERPFDYMPQLKLLFLTYITPYKPQLTNIELVVLVFSDDTEDAVMLIYDFPTVYVIRKEARSW